MEAHTVTTIVCRKCHADLAVSAAFCDQCGTPTNADPPTSSAPSNANNSRPLLDRPWVIVVLLLHVGVLGIPAYWAANYSVSTRLLIILASILYTLFAVVVIVWSLRQIAEAVSYFG
jgi:hypothetical protein